MEKSFLLTGSHLYIILPSDWQNHKEMHLNSNNGIIELKQDGNSLFRASEDPR